MSARDIIEWEGLEPGDLDDLLKLEREIGFELPERYKQIAAKYDGARPVKKTDVDFYSVFDKRNDFCDIGRFLEYVRRTYPIQTRLWNWTHKPETLPEKCVAFSELGNGDLICFDYRESKEPKIVLWHFHGTEPDETISFVANNFDEFLEKLHEPRG
ncbi:MAG: SMI1/KNR4 family protein [Gammaproteobacteria bacterium]